MSWFHYELEPGTNRHGVDIDASMNAILDVLVSRGLFVLQIYTDFSGRFRDVRSHTWEQCKNFLERYGEIALFTDWHGSKLTDSEAAVRSGASVLGAIRKRQ